MTERLTLKKLLTVSAALIGAVVALLTLMVGKSWGPPASGIPNIVVSKKCVVYGHAIPVEGGGFAPGTAVTLSAPEGHYTGPPSALTAIRDVTVTADATGGITGSLRAPRAPRRLPWSYQPRVIFATGTAQVGEEEGQSFDEVLLGTRAVCQALEVKKATKG